MPLRGWWDNAWDCPLVSVCLLSVHPTIYLYTMTTITLPSGDTLPLKGCKHIIHIHKHQQADEGLDNTWSYSTTYHVEHRWVNKKKEIVYSRSRPTYKWWDGH